MSSQPPTFRAALRFWCKLGFISFGGPAAQIALMQQELVERRRWVAEDRFLRGLNLCLLLPGPEAQQLAVYLGWLLHKTRGGIAAGVLFVLPSAVLLWCLSWVYVSYGQVPAISAVFHGLKPAVMAIVASALLRLGRKALRNAAGWSIAALAFLAIYLFHAPYPAIVAAAGAWGWAAGPREQGDAPASASHASWSRAARVLGLGLALWWAPVLAAGAWQGWQGTLFRQGVFFSKAAMVTFGGAYAVLPYVSQQAVDHYGWLSSTQMLDGLGLAETTPGPLIIVLEFVGFLGGWNHHPGGQAPLLAATLGAAMTVWATFTPCFIWVFLAAPHVEQLRHQPRLSAALGAITAAVVGVMFNLAVWFGAHALWPRAGVFDWFAAGVAALAFLALERGKWGLAPVIAASGLAGLIWRLATGG